MIKLQEYSIYFRADDNTTQIFCRKAISAQEAVNKLITSHDESWRSRIIKVRVMRKGDYD